MFSHLKVTDETSEETMGKQFWKTGKYAVSIACSDGKLPERGRKAGYYYGSLGSTVFFCSDPVMVSVFCAAAAIFL